MPNVQLIIYLHNNKQIFKKNEEKKCTQQNKKECNCRSPQNCPVSGKYLTEGIVYQATATRHDNNTKKATSDFPIAHSKLDTMDTITPSEMLTRDTAPASVVMYGHLQTLISLTNFTGRS